jgi:hypothetical protein
VLALKDVCKGLSMTVSGKREAMLKRVKAKLSGEARHDNQVCYRITYSALL